VKPDGVLVVDKPAGPTSHAIVAEARRLLGMRQVGHAGTLDPLATGVLLLLLGEACKLAPYLTAGQKTYRASVRFGRETDSLDAAGRTIRQELLRPGWLTRAALDAALGAEQRRTEQQPPAFSAIKVGGRAAHRLSRRGAPPELASRPVRMASLVLLEASDSGVELELAVSKGYYVRSFARDLGARLGVPAHLGALRRTASGDFTLAEAVRWPPGSPPCPIPTARAAERALGAVRLAASGVARAVRGQPLVAADFETDPASAHAAAAVAWLGPYGELVAIGRRDGDGYVVLRGFRQREGY
jgi:tRNA pseudouridine55 synthase